MAPQHGVAALLQGFMLACAMCQPAHAWKTINDFRGDMYWGQKYSGGCYLLLNSTGMIGCQQLDGAPSKAPLMATSSVTWPLTEDRVLLVQMDELEALLVLLRDRPLYRQHVVGVVVDPRGAVSSQSAADTFPNAFAAAYDDKSYIWNPAGTGLWAQYLPLPVITLTEDNAEQAVWRAAKNEENGFTGATHVCRVELKMHASQDSLACLEKRTCQPLGAFSVWSALPYMPPLPIHNASRLRAPDGSGGTRVSAVLPEPSTPLPITLVIAQVDTNGLFHDLMTGAGSPLSGLVAMLTAMDLLKGSSDTGAYTRRILFLALAGEPWGHMGARRLLWELDPRGATAQGLNTTFIGTQGFNMELVDQVVEVGMVGRAYDTASNTTRLFAHEEGGGTGMGNASALVALLQEAGGNTTDLDISVSPASTTNPGLPPSSLMAFLKYKPSIAGVVLAEYDSQYINPYYQSNLDNASYVQVEAMYGTALVLARALHKLCSPTDTPPLQPDPNTAKATAIALAQCLMLDDPGLTCDLATQVMKPGSTNMNARGERRSLLSHYIGLMPSHTPDPTSTNHKADVQRFLFNFMANASAAQRSDTPCDPLIHVCPDGMVCFGWMSGTNLEAEQGSMGRCISSTTLYVPSFSTRLVEAPDMNYRILPESSEFNGAYGWPPDAIWTESNWPRYTPQATIYLEDAYWTQVYILIAGILLTLLTGALSFIARHMFDKHLKSQ